MGEKAVFEYLASGAVKGTGPGQPERFWTCSAPRRWTSLKTNRKSSHRFEASRPKRAQEIGESFRQQMGVRRLAQFLSEHQLPLSAAMPLYRRFGDLAVDMIAQSPYLLADRELDISFSQVDALAISLGVAGDDPQRVEAALMFELEHNADNGHVFLPQDKLLSATGALIGVEGECLNQGLETFVEMGEVVREDIAGVTACYPAGLYAAECYVAMRLGEMCQAELAPPHDLDKLIDQIQGEQGIVYARAAAYCCRASCPGAGGAAHWRAGHG